MKYIYAANCGFDTFRIILNGNNYKSSKIGYYFSSLYESYVFVFYCAGREQRVAMASRPDYETMIKGILQKLKKQGVIDFDELRRRKLL